MVMRFILPVVKQYATSKYFVLLLLIFCFYLNIRLLADIQCLNLKTLKWEYITTLINPMAAWLDEIFLKNKTVLSF